MRFRATRELSAEAVVQDTCRGRVHQNKIFLRDLVSLVYINYADIAVVFPSTSRLDYPTP